MLVLYLKRGCPYCNKVLDNIDGNDQVELYYCDEDFKYENFKRKYGESATFPRGYIKEGKKVRLLKDSNEILNYLKK
jgi:hypothetical protein